MNILHLNDKIEIKGGVEIYLQQLVELLPEYSIEAHWLGVYELNGYYELKSFLNDSENLSNISFDKLIGLLSEFVSLKNIDVIHIQSISSPKLIEACFDLAPVVRSMHEPRMICPGQGKFLRVSEIPCEKKFGLHCFKNIYVEHCSNRHPKRVLSAWKYVNYEINEAQYRYKKIIVMSDYMKNELIKGGVIESRIVVNPYFTEINNFNNGSQQSRINLLFIGRLINSKGPHYAIEAVKDILLQKENVFLEIIGDGEMKGFLEKKCKELGIVHKVKFHGWKDKKFIKDMLNRSYLVIFPSVYPEAFGIVGIEAMMAGKPVIAFNVGGVNMWLKDNFNGFLIQPKDVSTMKTKINNLIEDKILYQSFCLNAKREAISKFIPDIHINNLIIIYKDAIRKN